MLVQILFRLLLVALYACTTSDAAEPVCGQTCTLDTDCALNPDLTCGHCVRGEGAAQGTCACSNAIDTDIEGDTIGTECCGLQPFDCCVRCINFNGNASKCVAAVWSSEGIVPGSCTYKRALTGFYKSAGGLRPSTAGRTTSFPFNPAPPVYTCDQDAGQCSATASTSQDVKNFWYSQEDCGTNCAASKDPCTELSTCKTCFNNPQCGWCSQNVTYSSGKMGGQCATVSKAGKFFSCPAQFSKDTCTGTDSPVQAIPVGSNPDDFFNKFKATVLSGIDTPTPDDFNSLADTVNVAPGGSFKAGLGPTTVGPWVASLQIPDSVKAKMKYALPALMFAGAGNSSTMVFQAFNVAEDDGLLTLCHAAVLCMEAQSGDKTCDVAFVHAEATAHVIQQTESYHVDCCSCKIGDCGWPDWLRWMQFCHGCDRTKDRDDTATELAHIKQGLQASVYASYADSFPVNPPLPARSGERTMNRPYMTMESANINQEPQPTVQVAHASSAASFSRHAPLPVRSGDRWGDLKKLLHAFTNRAQHVINKPSKDSTVQQVKTLLKSISEDTVVLRIPQVALADVPAAIQAGSSGYSINETIINRSVNFIMSKVATARALKGNVTWLDKDSVQSDGVKVTYFSVSFNYDPTVGPGVDLVMCMYKSEMHLSKLTIETSTHYNWDGSTDINITEKETTINGTDLKEFEILWKYAVDDAILKSLDGKLPSYTTPRMRLLPWRLKAASKVTDGDSFDSFKDFLMLAASQWQNIVNAFKHESQKVKFISKTGFSQFNEETVTYAVPAVHLEDTKPFIDSVMDEYSNETRDVAYKQLMALEFGHPIGNDTDAWLRQHIVWNKTSKEGGCGAEKGCAEFFIAHLQNHSDMNHNNWVICAYKADFVLAPEIEIVENSVSGPFGLFKSEHDVVKYLPRDFTDTDKNMLSGFMSVQCQFVLAQMFGQHPKVPDFPPMTGNPASERIVV